MSICFSTLNPSFDSLKKIKLLREGRVNNMNLIVRCLVVQLWPTLILRQKKMAIHNKIWEMKFFSVVSNPEGNRIIAAKCRQKSTKKSQMVCIRFRAEEMGKIILIEDGMNWIKMDRNTVTDNTPKGWDTSISAMIQID